MSTQQTPLYAEHIAAGAKMVDFSGWQLPIHYGSLIEEHHAVRKNAGVFDVSHMAIVDVSGSGATAWLQYLLCNDVAKLAHGQALYSCMCNENGGVVDDLIVYFLSENNYRLVVNAATREKDIAWFEKHKTDAVVLDYPTQTAMMAVQGPEAIERASGVLAAMGVQLKPNALKRFSAFKEGDWFIARTGYTGEDGLEITVPAALSVSLWRNLMAAGVVPIGLGARDTLRLEACMSLYGNDLDEAHTPIESGLSWVVDTSNEDRNFIGAAVMREQLANKSGERRIALKLLGRGVLRGGQAVQLAGKNVGVVTSGTFSPTLQCSIALARVSSVIDGNCDVLIRDKPVAAQAVGTPFVKNGQSNLS